MKKSPEKLRYILQYYYDRGNSASQAYDKICSVYGEEVLSKFVARKWFTRFRSGNFDVKEEARSGRPLYGKADKIIQKVQQDKHVSSANLAMELGVDYKTVWNHLHKAGFQKNFDVWVPVELSVQNLLDRINICNALLKRNEIEPFLERVITSGEKWISFDFLKLRSCKIEEELFSMKPVKVKKMMMCVWWDWKGIIHHEVLPVGQRINYKLYCEQLDRLNEQIRKKRPELTRGKGVILHHDNSRPHITFLTRSKLQEYQWELLMHPPYSPDMSPSDYHLFRNLHDSFKKTDLISAKTCEEKLTDIFNSKPVEFFTEAIMALPEKWRRIVDNDGAHIV